MSGVSTIPPDLCFVTTLASGLWARAKGDPLALASLTIYLPTRRACRALRDAFLRVTMAKASLLPRLQPLGDVDEVELDFAGAGSLEGIPPAIASLRRQMLLTQLVQKKDPALPLDQAVSLAATLGALLDQAQTEGCDFAALSRLVREDYAKHWQETLLFLEIITKEWPSLLKGEGCLDPAARRDAILDAQAAQWRMTPPSQGVIAAGSTGSIPAVGRLMAVIAALPKGEVILPGLDLDLEETAWQEIDDTHPQATMKHWLEQAKVKRADVEVWQGVSSPRRDRVRLAREALLPAKVTERWRHLTSGDMPPEATQGVERLDLDHHREEADVIAVRLRAALEEEGVTAALVTPDRVLASRVAAALGRWGIAANDSAGAPLSQWRVGSFLIDCLAAASPESSPVDYLALLKHPLAAAGIDLAQCRHRARLVELKVWRGVRLAGGWKGAAEALKKEEPDTAAWLVQIEQTFEAMTKNWTALRSLEEHRQAHIALAEALAATDSQAGGERLWRGDDGEAAVAWLDEWQSSCAGFPRVTGADYARLFRALIGQVTVRPAFGQHPRLSILGPLEARLLHHDLVILGGLNEGTWPPAPPVDPWLSRPMKRDFGLSSPERRVGLSAHDFAQLFCAERVLLTRARRVGGSPTVPSRFLLQLETTLQAARGDGAMAMETPWRAWAAALDRPEDVKPMSEPLPRPPVDLRPKTLSVTEISTWMRNPYAIYAKHVLGLRKLEDIDADVSAADHGNVIHEALEHFLRKTLAVWPADPLPLLLEAGRRAFAPFESRPQVKAFWWPRFENIAKWFVEQEEARRAEGLSPLAVEVEGARAFGVHGFRLKGRADRIDRLPDGTIAIVDYKTGGIPSVSQVLAGYEPQLALLALIAETGGFEEIGKAEAGALSYWQLRGRKEPEKVTSFTENLEDQKGKAAAGLDSLLEAFADPQTPYAAVPKPRYAPRHNDYAHLSRLAEWGRVEGGES